MLERVKNILKMADECRTAALSFICIDYNMVWSVIKGAEKKNTPVIVMLLPEHREINNAINTGGFAAMAKEMASAVSIPVGIHLDHSYDYASVIRAIQAGFPSVMIDGSAHSLDENIQLTKKTVETGHILGVDVEAEIGHVGLAADYEQSEMDYYTKPDAVDKFCRETECDSLAVAIGNAHGVYADTPHLDIQRLQEINAVTDVPLVLHGGSGIPDDQMLEAFHNGINKCNVGTEFLGIYLNAERMFIKEHDGSGNPLDILEQPIYIQEKLIDYIENKLKLCEFN